MNTTETYKVKPIVCRACGESIEVIKKKNRVSIHQVRLARLANHIKNDCLKRNVDK